MTLRTLLLRLRAEYGTWASLAAKVGVVPQALPIGLKVRGTLSLEVLLRVAEVAGESPTAVLRAGGKVHEAALLERLYGKPRKPMSEEHRELIAAYDRLPLPLKRTIMTLLAHLTMRAEAS